jgi:hypothetical protein
MSHPHIDHVHAHLDRVRQGHLVDPAPEALYLGAQEDEHFWELVGFRLAGCPVVVLALLRFRNLDLPAVPFARESLATYLSLLPAPRATDEAGVLTAILPPHDQSVPFFLKRLRAGLQVTPVSLDPARIQLAFDFRLQNPTLIPNVRDGAEPLQDHYCRTADGHLLHGRSHAIPATAPAESQRFVTIASAEQITPRGVHPLPTLFVNREYLALRAQAHTPEEMAAVRNWVPFMAASAISGSLLALPAPRGPLPRMAPRRPAEAPVAGAPPP